MRIRVAVSHFNDNNKKMKRLRLRTITLLAIALLAAMSLSSCGEEKESADQEPVSAVIQHLKIMEKQIPVLMEKHSNLLVSKRKHLRFHAQQKDGMWHRKLQEIHTFSVVIF